ncbi:nucleotide exchange factor GrpE [Sinomicrobium sp.]
MAKKNKHNTEENKDVATEVKNSEEQELSIEEQLKEELSKEKDKFLRLFAEFENYKKRTAKERIDLFKTAGQDVLSAMLPVLDDFDRAIAEIKKSTEEETGIVNELLKGVELINSKFTETLKNKGLTLIEVNQGDTFDAELHEAITQISAPSEDMKGKIIDVIEKGYKLGEKIIRYPKVVVGN